MQFKDSCGTLMNRGKQTFIQGLVKLIDLAMRDLGWMPGPSERLDRKNPTHEIGNQTGVVTWLGTYQEGGTLGSWSSELF